MSGQFAIPIEVETFYVENQSDAAAARDDGGGLYGQADGSAGSPPDRGDQ